MSETILNPRTPIIGGATLSDSNPVMCSSVAALGSAAATAILNPVTWVINGAVVSDTNPLPIDL